MKLSIQEIYQAALTAGFTPDQATTWTAIALAESGGETGALNDSGEHSVGLWQINLAVHQDKWGPLSDPVNNARAAYEISRQGTDLRPWTVTHASNAGTARDYRSYLDEVSAVTGYAGDDRGVEGYGAPLLDPLPPSGPDDGALAAIPASSGSALTSTGALESPPIDLVTDPGSGLDTDQDGLTDAFERMVGTDVNLVDTDSDGLTDVYETVATRTDPLLADTDQDTLSDSLEVTLGTSGTAWDTDEDGASDGAEVQYGADPLHREGEKVPAPTGVATLVDPAGGGSSTTASRTGGSLVDAFVQAATAQRGDEYVFGAEASLDDSNPDTFDCSELTQWAADQVGVTIPDGAMYQYLELKQQGELMPVEEALRTKGALLFYFSSEPTPGGGRPSTAHVAISLGDGRTIEARGSSYGVNEFPAADRFNYAGVIPGLSLPVGTVDAGTGVGVGAAAGGLVGAVDPGVDTGPVGGVLPDVDGAPGPPATPATMPGATVDPDADDDGLSDAFEEMLDLNPLLSDSDGDGISDAEEQLGEARLLSGPEVRNALAAEGLSGGDDEDADGLTNRFELRHGFDLRNADSDADGLIDSAEVALGTDPLRLDTDSDGITDKLELELGTDPLQGGDPTEGWGLEPSGSLPDPPG